MFFQFSLSIWYISSNFSSDVGRWVSILLSFLYTVFEFFRFNLSDMGSMRFWIGAVLICCLIFVGIIEMIPMYDMKSIFLKFLPILSSSNVKKWLSLVMSLICAIPFSMNPWCLIDCCMGFRKLRLKNRFWFRTFSCVISVWLYSPHAVIRSA